ncbi:MMPL family transporter [Mycobacterium spongiae]|uniref:MMPL family transporter n=1 Tax=Mycobacterium spongiae TaxID=886343 RepID=A0A975JWX6_9MYCO|nr:MMPL family transporter [Mycobacterium spongiae]QUR66888.1 MMPL family transporter [Mycobacterium spongiae]
MSSDRNPRSSRLAKILIVAAWIAVTVTANLILALTEPKAQDAGSALLPQDATTAAANSRIAQAFPGTGTNAIAYLVLEGRDPLGPADERFYDAAVRALRADSEHVGSVLDWWSDPLTAPLGTSADGRRGIAVVWLRGEAGTDRARESLASARSVVHTLPHGAGLRARIAVPATTTDMPLRMSVWQGAAIVAVAAVVAILLLLRPRTSRAAVGTAAVALLTAALSLALAWPLAVVLRLHLAELSAFSVTVAAVLTIGTITTSTLLVRRGLDESGSAMHRGRYRDALPALALPGLGIAMLTGPLLLARTPSLHSVGVAALGVVVALGASLTLLPSLIGLVGSAGPPAVPQQASSRIASPTGTRPPPIPGFSRRIGVIAVVLAVCAAPVIGMRWGIDEDSAATPAARFFPANQLPDVVLLEADADLRDPAGLIAIDHVSRRLMEIPGVRKVQSAAWPGGVPWTDASLTATAGRLSDQLDRQAATFVPQVNSIKTLASVVDQVTGAVNELDKSVTAGVAGLTEMQRSIDVVISGTRNIKDTTAEVSEYLDPVRGWMGSIQNCAADALCSAIRKVVDPFDSVIADVAVLSDGADQIAAGSTTAVGAIASTPHTVAQMRSALAQLSSLVPTLETTVEDTLPQVVQLSAFLRNLSTDFADTGEGGFYLPRKALADASYRHVRHTMFSADGTATRLFIYSDVDTLGLNAAARVRQLDSAVASTTKYGSLLDSRITVSGASQVAASLRDALTHDVVLLGLATLAVVALVTMWRGVAGGLAIGLGTLASFLAALGISVLLFQHLLGRELQASAALVSFAVLAAFGVPHLIARLVASPEAATMPVRGAVASLTALGAVFGGGLLLLSGTSLGALSQVGSVLLIGLAAVAAVAHVCLPAATSTDPTERPAS